MDSVTPSTMLEDAPPPAIDDALPPEIDDGPPPMIDIAARIADAAYGTTSGDNAGDGIANGGDAGSVALAEAAPGVNGGGDANGAVAHIDAPIAPAPIAPAPIASAPAAPEPIASVDGGAGPAPLARLTHSFDIWARSLQDGVRGAEARASSVAHRFAAVEHGVAELQSGLQDVRHDVQGVQDAVQRMTGDLPGLKNRVADDIHGVKQQADAALRRAEEGERQLLGVQARLDQHQARAENFSRDLSAGAAATGQVETRVAALDGDLGSLKQEIAGLAATNRILVERTRRLNRAMVLAYIALAAAAVWLTWPALKLPPP
jgi:hypothetical protein